MGEASAPVGHAHDWAQQSAQQEGRKPKAQKLKIKSRANAGTAPKVAAETPSVLSEVQRRWLDDIERDAAEGVGLTDFPVFDWDAEWSADDLPSLPDGSDWPSGLQEDVEQTPAHSRQPHAAHHSRDTACGAVDNSSLPQIQQRGSLPDLHFDRPQMMPYQRPMAEATDQWGPLPQAHAMPHLAGSWQFHHAHPDSHSSFGRPHSQHNQLKRPTAAQHPAHNSYSTSATLAQAVAAPQPEMRALAAAAPRFVPPHSAGLPQQRAQDDMARQIQSLQAQLRSAMESADREKEKAADAARQLEQERQRFSSRIQSMQDCEASLREDIDRERRATADARKELDDERQKRVSSAQSDAANATLRKAMELRIGIQAPPELLSRREEYLQQAEIALKFWSQFESAFSASGAGPAFKGGEKSSGKGSSGKGLDTVAKFEDAAHGVCKGLLAAVMLLNSAAHQFQHGLDDASRRRPDLVGGRSRIREAQDKLKKIATLISALAESNSALASAGGTMEGDAEYARRAVFVQAASVCQRRLVTIGETEYLSCERISVQQTRQHAHAKHVEFVRLRETLKQLSPASDTSCADVAAISPRAHVGGRGNSHSGGMSDSTQTLLELGQGFHLAQKRLEASVESALKVTQEAPRLREDLLRLFNALGRVADEDVVSKGRSIAWAMAAMAGEFGLNVSQNVGTLQYAVETLKRLLPAEGRAAKGVKRKVPA